MNPILAGALITGASSLIGGERRNKSQISQADRQMQFQEDMSNTAYQRAVKDMRKAGINPILAASRGGASTPGGAMAQIMDTVTPAVSTALQSQSVTANVSVAEETATKLAQDALTSRADEWKKSAERAFISLSYNEKLLAMKLLEEQIAIAHRDGTIAASTYGQIMRYIKEFSSSILGGGSLVPRTGAK